MPAAQTAKKFQTVFKIRTGASYISTIVTPPLRYNEPTLTEKEALP